MGPIWRVRMLGGLQADSEDVSITRFRTRRVGLLLAYLAYYQDRRHSREELADMLWPELEPEHAKRNLRQALSSLRHHLEPPGVPPGAVLDARQSLVSLNAEHLSTDVAEFVRSLRSAPGTERFSEAVELYRGDLLPGFYEDWVLRERLHLEDRYVSALRLAMDAAQAEGRLDDAIRFTRIAIGKDGLDETLHGALIRLYIAAGRPQSAAQHYEDWRVISRNELRCEPSPELRKLIEGSSRPPAEAKIEIPSSTYAERSASTPAEVEEYRATPIARLPIQLTRFFGRGRELENATNALAAHSARLLTVVGPAGTGKTRISIEVGRTLAERHGWNVWFVPLADISDGANVVDATLAALKLESRSGDPLEAIADRLDGDDNLLILDNMEHILEQAAPRVAEMLLGLPNASFLVTSRQSLRLEGEQEIDLATLPTPNDEDYESPTLIELAAVPSVQLFVDRARLVLPDFQLTTNNARPISEICRKLDGLPLALEIAASLSGAFSPHQLLQNLENRLELLRSRRRDLSSRHRTLRAAIDYSYNLLSEELRTFFVRLSVFRGGFTVEAADQVCVDAGAPATGRRKRRSDDCLRMILDLQERSLLRADETKEDSPARFRLLESYREYAREYLDADAEADLGRRHAGYFLRQAVNHTTPAEDRDNRNAAVRFLFEQREVHDCITLLCAFEGFSVLEREIIQTFARAEDFETFEPRDRVRLLRLSTDSHVYRSEFEEALRTCRYACALAEEFGLEDELSLCHRKLSLVLVYLNRRHESIERSEQDLVEGKRKGDLRAIEFAYTNIGVNHWALGDFAASREAYEGAYRASMELHNGEAYWPVLYNLSLVTLDLGLLDDGLHFANEGLRRAQANDEEFGVSMCLAMISRYHLYKKNLPAAIATSYSAMVKRRKVGFMYWTFQSMFYHAAVLLEMGRYREATTIFGASRTVAKVNAREAEQHMRRLRAALSPEQFERAWAEGLSMNLDQAFRFSAQFR